VADELVAHDVAGVHAGHVGHAGVGAQCRQAVTRALRVDQAEDDAVRRGLRKLLRARARATLGAGGAGRRAEHGDGEDGRDQHGPERVGDWHVGPLVL
jgi:hypothetical protein